MSSEFDRNDPHTILKKPPSSVAPFVPERLLDSDEAAAIMNCHPKTLQKLARKGVVRESMSESSGGFALQSSKSGYNAS